MTELSYHDARARAVIRELEDNPELLLIGGEVAFPINPDFGLLTTYADRVLWPPISEFANITAAVGASMAGLRILIPVATSGFMFYGWAAVVHEAANARYLSGGRVSAPVTIHLQAGSRGAGAAQHEHMPQAMLQNVPGLRLYQPGTPAEIDAVFHRALTDDDPTLIFDHTGLIDYVGPVTEQPADPDVPTLVRTGDDVLVVASGIMVQHALEAADALAEDGVSVAILSNALISPAPIDALLHVIGGHDRVLFLDEARGPGSPTSYVMSRMLIAGMAPSVAHLHTLDAPSPFADNLLHEVVPDVPRVTAALRTVSGLDDDARPHYRPATRNES
jgi:pyruvate/2-oxoglutarate/acetoin dehydrogenase E1 component